MRKLSGPSDQRFENLEWASTENGAIHLEGADAQLTTKLHDLQEIGDHFFAVLEVIDASADQDFSSALVYHRSQVSSL